MKAVIVVGAGITGCASARILSENGFEVFVYESDDQPGGLCREISVQGWKLPKYGPHIIRTSDRQVEAFLLRFSSFRHYRHRVKTLVQGALEDFPPALSVSPLVNSPDYAAKNLEQYLINAIGKRNYEVYYKGYTTKKWGVEPVELSASLIPLMPVQRGKHSYFPDRFQGIPESGFTELCYRLLDSPKITFCPSSKVNVDDLPSTHLLIWCARIDSFFQYKHGQLPYASLKQTINVLQDWPPDASGCAVINNPDPDVPYIRETNYSILLHPECGFLGREFPQIGNVPAYPVLTHATERVVKKYMSEAQHLREHIIFAGRLGRFEYNSMDSCISQAFQVAKEIKNLA